MKEWIYNTMPFIATLVEVGFNPGGETFVPTG
jgi:hypothetical protein